MRQFSLDKFINSPKNEVGRVSLPPTQTGLLETNPRKQPEKKQVDAMIQEEETPQFKDKRRAQTYIPPKQPAESPEEEQFADRTPHWATKEGCKDKAGRRPDDPNYDPSSLMVPPQELKGMTPTMRQYWRIKADNFDRIVLFKLGKFYQMFYEDAQAGHDLLDLKWMGKKMHTGFPEKALDRYMREFVAHGLRVVVVQQMETPDEMNKRVKSGHKQQKVIKREVTQVCTAGTFVPEEASTAPRYLLAFYLVSEQVSSVLLDLSVNRFYFPSVSDSANQYLQFRTLLYKTRPLECLYVPAQLNQPFMQMLKAVKPKMLLSPLPETAGQWHTGLALNLFHSVYGGEWPPFLKQVSGNSMYMTCLSGIISYLEKVLAVGPLKEGICQFLPYQLLPTGTMLLDSQAIHHLQVTSAIDQAGSLFGFVNRTSTAYGKRLLERWLTSPLISPALIRQRQAAVSQLQKLRTERKQFLKLVKAAPDLERAVAKISKFTIKSIANEAVYFADVSGARFNELKDVLKHFQSIGHGLANAFGGTELESSLLKFLLRKPSEGGKLPNLEAPIAEIIGLLNWSTSPPSPKRECCEEYDQVLRHKAQLVEELGNRLNEVRSQMGDYSISYLHTKNRYQIEVPMKLVKKFTSAYETVFSSSRVGFERYVLKDSKKTVAALELAEERQKKVVNGYAKEVFKAFAERQALWQAFVGCLAELDALCSLSLVAELEDMARPQIIEEGPPYLQIRDARHPCLVNTGHLVVPNDVVLDSRRLMLLTGPNMGGKSTFMRTVAVLAILAQVGSWVPASRYRATVVDRVFTRLGASDQLQLGKSTFMIEMEEAGRILKEGTQHSLAIIDELGRGTSTKDGISIAYGVLKYLAEHKRMLGLFATHFHRLIQLFESHPGVQLGNVTTSTRDREVVFEYKIKEGFCSQSLGFKVAEMAGVWPSIISQAEEVSRQARINVRN